jgi:hypothetical protein
MMALLINIVNNPEVIRELRPSTIPRLLAQIAALQTQLAAWMPVMYIGTVAARLTFVVRSAAALKAEKLRKIMRAVEAGVDEQIQQHAVSEDLPARTKALLARLALDLEYEA